MIDVLNNSLLKIIGSVDTNIDVEMNGVNCLRNKHRTIYKVDNLDEAKQIIGDKFELLDKFNPDGLMLKTMLKEYPFLVLLRNEINLDYPNTFYYQKNNPLVLEYSDCCYIFCEMEKNKLEGLI